jgi:hypothetical protein
MKKKHSRPDRPPRTTKDLTDLLPHLCYEVKMLLATDLLLLREGVAPRNRNDFAEWAIHNALLESHTIHARALYAFLFQGPAKDGDATAADYAFDWPRKRPKPAAVLVTVSPRVGREIAHLTYGRLAYKTDGDRQWDFTDITRGLVVALNAWLVDAPEYVRRSLMQYVKDYAAQAELLDATRKGAEH